MISYLTKQFQAVPALMAIYRELGGRFVSTRTNTIRAIHRNNSNVIVNRYVEKLGSLSSGYHCLKNSQAIITGGPYATLLKKFDATKVMIFTGTTPSLTAKQIREDHAHFNKLCAIGPRMMRTIEQSGLDVEAVLAGYFPFLSFPQKSDELRTKILQRTGLDLTHKTVVYLPRGEPFGSFDIMMPKLLEVIPRSSFNLIVRPHPSQSVKLHLRDRIRLFRMLHHVKSTKNVYLDMNQLLLSELLSIADMVITDGNSPAEEALFYDTPQMLVESARLSRDTISHSMRSQGSSAEDIELALRIYDNGLLIVPETPNLIERIELAFINADRYAPARHANYDFVFGLRNFDRQHAVIQELRQYSN